MPRAFEWTYACAKVRFGPGAVEALRGYLHGYKRVYLVMGRRAAAESGALADVRPLLDSLGIEYGVYDQVVPNPPSSLADDLAARVSRFSAEAIIAIGGGSTIDTAKVAAAIAANGGSSLDYLYGRRRATRCLPLFVINLTHGTGSEVNRYANMTDVSTGDKLGNEVCYPTASFDDPRYTLSMPLEEVLCTSFDALYHAYEAATTAGSSPLAQALAEEAVRRIAEYLPLAASNPKDENARYWLMYASMLAGVAIDLSPTNIIHLFENMLSGLVPSLPHGCGLALIGPSLVPLVHSASPEPSTRLLRILDPNVRSPEDAGAALARFVKHVGFSRRLSDYGVGKDIVREAVRRAFKNPVVAERLRNRLSGVQLDEQRVLQLLLSAV